MRFTMYSFYSKHRPITGCALEPSCDLETQELGIGIPLVDIISGAVNGSPIPPEFIGEGLIDEDDVPRDFVDPHACFGFDRFEREEFAKQVASRDRANKATSTNKKVVGQPNVDTPDGEPTPAVTPPPQPAPNAE